MRIGGVRLDIKANYIYDRNSKLEVEWMEERFH